MVRGKQGVMTCPKCARDMKQIEPNVWKCAADHIVEQVTVGDMLREETQPVLFDFRKSKETEEKRS